MADGRGADDKAPENKTTDERGADDKAPENKTTDERAKWTTSDWEDFAQREADRRVTDAQKKWRQDLTEQLTAKEKDAETKITEALTKAEQAETRAAFVEQATSAGIADLKAAWALVQTSKDDFTDRRGNVDFEKLKTEHPALFGGGNKQRPVGNAPGDAQTAPKNLGEAMKQAIQRKQA